MSSGSKGKVLLVDDSFMNRALMCDILGDEYEVIEAENGVEAMAVLARMHSDLTLMLLDIVMPEMDGFEVLAAMNKSGWIEEVPVIIISSEDSYTYVDHAYDLGATEYIQRPFDEKMVKHRVENTVMLHAKQRSLEKMVIDQMLEKEKSNIMMVNILSHIVEFRNGESGMHVLHIRVLTEVLLERLAKMTDKYDLTPERISLIANASALHDIGKIAIPEEVLNKPGRFTPEERLIMQAHSAAGAEMLENLPYYGDEELVKVAHDICRWHHERYDGKGYPDGLAGEEIPIAAQVVALADVYDALTSERVYKPAYTHEEAMRMIQGGECGTFSPLLLACLREADSYLEKELKVKSNGGLAHEEMTNLPRSLLKVGGASSRKLQMLEQERDKRIILSRMSKNIQFEYEYAFELLTFNEYGARMLGLPETVSRPRKSENMRKTVNFDDLHELIDRLQAVGQQDPPVEMTVRANLPGGEKKFDVVAQSLWIDDERTGVIGLATPAE